MVTKCVRKHTMVIMELLILFVLDVQANNLPPTSFSSSLPPTMLPYSFEFDEAKGTMQKCLTNRAKGCLRYGRIWPFPNIKYEICVLDTFWKCFFHMRVFEERITGNRILNCVNTNCYSRMRMIHIHARSRFVSCVLECCEENMERH